MSNQTKTITVEAIEAEVKKPEMVKTNNFDAKNYLNVKLEDGENKKELKIRILTCDKNSSSPFMHIHTHSVKVPKEVSKSGWKSYICLKHTEGSFNEKLGRKCPFCELRDEAYKNSIKPDVTPVEKERWQKLSCSNIPNETSIIRCIERGHENEGPKFWKFNLRTDELDPEHQIRKIYATRKNESIDDAKFENGGELPEGFIPENILDIDNGKDFLVTITRVFDKQGNPTDKTSVTITDYGKNKPLSNDKEQRDAWLNDEKTWSDVFVAKPYEYLSIILDGDVPYYDKANGRWSTKAKIDEERNGISGNQTNNAANDAFEEAISVTTVKVEENNDEELPF